MLEYIFNSYVNGIMQGSENWTGPVQQVKTGTGPISGPISHKTHHVEKLDL